MSHLPDALGDPGPSAACASRSPPRYCLLCTEHLPILPCKYAHPPHHLFFFPPHPQYPSFPPPAPRLPDAANQQPACLCTYRHATLHTARPESSIEAPAYSLLLAIAISSGGRFLPFGIALSNRTPAAGGNTGRARRGLTLAFHRDDARTKEKETKKKRRQHSSYICTARKLVKHGVCHPRFLCPCRCSRNKTLPLRNSPSRLRDR